MFFCVKFSVYALLLWLPLFLDNELDMNSNEIANFASANELGTLFGGFTLGFLSDRCYRKRAPVGVMASFAAAAHSA